jgi:hypothetical protein
MHVAAPRVPPRLAHGDERPAALVPHGEEDFVARMTPRPPVLVQHRRSAERGEPSCLAREQVDCLNPPTWRADVGEEDRIHQPGGGTHPPNTKKLVELVGGKQSD